VNSTKFDRIFALLATLAVVVAAIAGFWLLGTPSRQRQIRADRERVEDIQRIAEYLHQQAELSQQQGQPVNLPASLPANRREKDPISGKPYDYQRLNSSQYKLCAEFATDSAADKLRDSRDSYYSTEQEFWQHPSGRYCFQLDVLEKPRELP
jgi:hypothetical protein